jgi:hypothetical protein
MRGVLMFAHNNELFNYGKMAYAAASAVMYYLNVPISLVTDKNTWKELLNEYPGAGEFFDQSIFIEKDSVNTRHFDMTDNTLEAAAYHNTTRLQAYDLSPYEETLLIDTDVLIQDSTLNHVWGQLAPIGMNRKISELFKDSNVTRGRWLETRSLQILWATIIYFRKGLQSQQFFDLTKYVVANYDYYGVLYGFSSKLIRVDFALTIAAHIMSGYLHKTDSVVCSLPNDSTLFAWGKDIMTDVQLGQATFVTNVDGQYFPVVTRQTVHCMNKGSMLENADRIIECYA